MIKTKNELNSEDERDHKTTTLKHAKSEDRIKASLKVATTTDESNNVQESGDYEPPLTSRNVGSKKEYFETVNFKEKRTKTKLNHKKSPLNGRNSLIQSMNLKLK